MDEEPILTNWGCDKHGNLLGYRVYDRTQGRMRLIGPEGHDRNVERDPATGEVVAIIDLVTGERMEPRQQPDAPRFVRIDESGQVIQE